MKTQIRLFALLAFMGLFLFSCSKDDDNDPIGAAPVISNFEYGQGSAHGHDHVAYKGSDIHMEAKIFAENKIASIEVDIHSHGLQPKPGEEEWHFNRVFTDAKYQVINATFHEHIDVPQNIPAGEYHVELRVTDSMGNTTEVEGHIQILDILSLSDIHIDETVVRGHDFHTEFNIFALKGIHKVHINIHSHGLVPGPGEILWTFDQDYHNYHGQTEASFHEHIDVPVTAPAGEYHMVVTVEDEAGNTVEHETHIDVIQ